jgi:hypothetical protein
VWNNFEENFQICNLLTKPKHLQNNASDLCEKLGVQNFLIFTELFSELRNFVGKVEPRAQLYFTTDI